MNSIASLPEGFAANRDKFCFLSLPRWKWDKKIFFVGGGTSNESAYTSPTKQFGRSLR